VEDKFTTWLTAQLNDRGWKPNDLAKKINASSATIYRIINHQRGVSGEMCKRIARALNISESEVMFQAGIISRDPKDPARGLPPDVLEIIGLLENQPNSVQAAALAMVKALLDLAQPDPPPAP